MVLSENNLFNSVTNGTDLHKLLLKSHVNPALSSIVFADFLTLTPITLFIHSKFVLKFLLSEYHPSHCFLKLRYNLSSLMIYETVLAFITRNFFTIILTKFVSNNNNVTYSKRYTIHDKQKKHNNCHF